MFSLESDLCSGITLILELAIYWYRISRYRISNIERISSIGINTMILTTLDASDAVVDPNDCPQSFSVKS